MPYFIEVISTPI